MLKDKFEMILENDEKVLWCGEVNSSASTKKRLFKQFLIGLLPPVAVILLGVPYSLVILILSLLSVLPLWIGVAHFALSVVVCAVYSMYLQKDAKNTFLCITNERVIKRSGALNNKFESYTLKNIGTIEVVGGLFDKKGKRPSANLLITVKDYHTNTDGNLRPKRLEVISLNNAYEAYKLLNERTKGNNEYFRIKSE